MSGFTKLVPEIVQSSIWNEPAEIRIMWITMLAIKDSEGYVRGDARTLARIANVTPEASEAALRIFQEPDVNSHTSDNEGRRIEPYAGGWLVLNHDKYRCKEQEIKEQTRERVRKHREKKNVTVCNVTETLPSASASASASSSVDLDKAMQGGDLWRIDQVIEVASSPSVAVSGKMAQECFDHYASQGWRNAAGNPVGRTLNEIGALLRKWKTKEPSIGRKLQDIPENETQAEKALRVEKMIRGIK